MAGVRFFTLVLFLSSLSLWASGIPRALQGTYVLISRHYKGSHQWGDGQREEAATHRGLCVITEYEIIKGLAPLDGSRGLTLIGGQAELRGSKLEVYISEKSTVNRLRLQTMTMDFQVKAGEVLEITREGTDGFRELWLKVGRVPSCSLSLEMLPQLPRSLL